MSGQTGEALSATASHTQQERVAKRLADDTTYTGHVFDGIHEEHQSHLSRADLVVVFQILLYHCHHLLHRILSPIKKDIVLLHHCHQLSHRILSPIKKDRILYSSTIVTNCRTEYCPLLKRKLYSSTIVTICHTECCPL